MCHPFSHDFSPQGSVSLCRALFPYLLLAFLQGGEYPTQARRPQGVAFVLGWSANWSTWTLNNPEPSLGTNGLVLVLPRCGLLDFVKFITEIPGTSCDHKSMPFHEIIICGIHEGRRFRSVFSKFWSICDLSPSLFFFSVHNSFWNSVLHHV